MTLKKMSVAANDIVLNNLVMREKTFKTIPDQLCSVLLNLQFYPTQLGKTPAWLFKSSPRLLCEPTSLPLLCLIPWKFHIFPLFFPGYLEGIQFSLSCPGVSHPLCCCLRVQPSPECSGQGRKIPSVPDVGGFLPVLGSSNCVPSAPQQGEKLETNSCCSWHGQARYFPKSLSVQHQEQGWLWRASVALFWGIHTPICRFWSHLSFSSFCPISKCRTTATTTNLQNIMDIYSVIRETTVSWQQH